MIETNLQGAIYCAQAAMVPMMARRRGHIAFVSSLAAWVPLADAPTYSATKAGVAAYGEALREFLLDYGVSVTTILPGHVRTAQTDAHMGATPMIIAPEQAARHITRGLARGNAVIAFPLAASWLTSLLAIAPWRLRARFARPSRFSCRKPVSRESLDLP